MAAADGGGIDRTSIYLSRSGMAALAQALRSSGHELASVGQDVDAAPAALSLAGTGAGRALAGIGDVVQQVFGAHAKEADESAWKLDRVVEIYGGRSEEAAAAVESTG
ncbi:MAG: hypothetical protein ACRC20_16845 [Segniliparus sp.]|uniref:hypothetical protein n=1 Tax=Segniliparus sp. TaxID=2804064 RepID=UPI003F400325